eukprot:4408662-Pyramimonas_sp.AAC.1
MVSATADTKQDVSSNKCCAVCVVRSVRCHLWGHTLLCNLYGAMFVVHPVAPDVCNVGCAVYVVQSMWGSIGPVSYTHLTLPTILLV